jgi:hypothetical protein
VATLRLGEIELRDHTASFGRVVLFDRRLETFAQWLGLAELAAEPAQQADVRRAV